MKLFGISFIVFTFVLGLGAQSKFSEIEKELATYNDYFVNADMYVHRVFAHKKFKELFEKALKTNNSIKYPFDSLKWISNLTAPDSSFRVFSWQLTESDSKRKYFGFIQLRDGTSYSLIDNDDIFRDMEYSSFSDDDWFGHLYYKIHQYKKGGTNNYLLFGYKLVGEMSKIKTAMPISFVNNEIVFGQEMFEDTTKIDGLKSMVVLETSVRSASSLSYNDNKDMIVFDHTTVLMIPDKYGKLHPMHVPDGSYHGYKWDGSKWVFIDKVFSKKYKDAPREKRRKEDKGKRSIFR